MSDLAHKIIDIINKNEETFKVETIRPNLVMLVGMTGAGKSTLLNYINGKLLEYYKDNKGELKLKVKAPATELPGIAIGQVDTTSCTKHANLYSPPNTSFSYVDTAGFGHTGELSTNNNTNAKVTNVVNSDASHQKTTRIAEDIVNAYFRSKITKNATALKIVWVVTWNDIVDKGGNLTKSLKELAHFIQGLESKDEQVRNRIKKAVSIVVTKVTDGNEEKLEQIKKIDHDIDNYKKFQAYAANSEDKNSFEQAIKDKEEDKRKLFQAIANNSIEKNVEVGLRELIETSPTLRELTYMVDILRYVVDHKQFAFFTKATVPGNKAITEATTIRELIENKTDYMSKQDANVRFKVADENISQVKNTIHALSNIRNHRLSNGIHKNIHTIFKAALSSNDPSQIQMIKTKYETIKSLSSSRTLPDFFKNINKILNLSIKIKSDYKEFNKILTFLVMLLPGTDHRVYFEKKNWISVLNLDTKLSVHSNVVSGQKHKRVLLQDILSTPEKFVLHTEIRVNRENSNCQESQHVKCTHQ